MKIGTSKNLQKQAFHKVMKTVCSENSAHFQGIITHVISKVSKVPKVAAVQGLGWQSLEFQPCNVL